MRLGVRRVLLQVLPILLIGISILALNIYTIYTQQHKFHETTLTSSQNIYIDTQGNVRLEETDTFHFGNNPLPLPVSRLLDIDDLQDPYLRNIFEDATLTCDDVLVGYKPRDINLDYTSPPEDLFSYSLPDDLTGQTCEKKVIYSEDIYGEIQTYTDFTVFDHMFSSGQIGTDVSTQSIDIYVHLPVPEDETILLDENTAVILEFPAATQHKVSVNGDTVHVRITPLEIQTNSYDSPKLKVLYPSTWDNLNSPNSSYETDERHFPYPSFTLEHITEITLTIFTIALIISLFILIRYKKKYRPSFKDKYWCDVPDPDIHPVVVSRLWGWNTKAQQKKDFPVLIMNLASRGAITLIEEKDASGKTEYVIEKQKGETESLTPLDEQVLELLFEEGEERITFPELKKKLAKRNSNQQIKVKISSIKKTIDNQTDELGTFTAFTMNGLRRYLYVLIALFATFLYLTMAIVKAFHLYNVEYAIYYLPDLPYTLFDLPHSVMLVIIVVFTAFALSDRLFINEALRERLGFWALAVISWAASLYLKSLETSKKDWCVNTDYAVLIAEVAAILFFLFGVFTLRPPNKVKEVVAKSKALKRWLEDFTLLDEKPPTDVEVWDEFMVYATAFGVADKTLATINSALPGITSNLQFISVASWVKKDTDNTSPFEKIGEFFTESISPPSTKTSTRP